MAARRYEISLRVLKNISRVSAANEWNIFQHEKRNFVSPSDHVIFYLLYKHQWNAKPFYLNSFFGLKGAVYYEAIATVIFSHLKITCYLHMWRYHIFVQKLTWYFIGVYIIKWCTWYKQSSPDFKDIVFKKSLHPIFVKGLTHHFGPKIKQFLSLHFSLKCSLIWWLVIYMI